MGTFEIFVFSALTLVFWCALRLISRPKIAADATISSSSSTSIRLLPMAPSYGSAPAELNSPMGRFDNWFNKVVSLTQSNWTTNEATWIIVGLALVAAVAAFVFTESSSSTIFAAVSAMLMGVIGFSALYRYRVAKFQSQLPQAMQLMARAVRAGESLEQAVHMVADSTEDPLSTEFRRCLKQVEMGLPVRKAMGSLAHRMNTLDTRLFGSTISVHRETGGGLADTLDRLATVIRKRFEYHQKLRSTTGAGRISVVIIAFLGLLIFTYMFLFRPDYGREMWTDPTGQTMLVFAAISETVGLIWVFFLLRAKY